MNMVKEDVCSSFKSILESSYHERTLINAQLLPLVFSPHKREQNTERYDELLGDQSRLALSLGSYLLEFFEDFDSFSQMLGKLIDSLQGELNFNSNSIDLDPTHSLNSNHNHEPNYEDVERAIDNHFPKSALVQIVPETNIESIDKELADTLCDEEAFSNENELSTNQHIDSDLTLDSLHEQSTLEPTIKRSETLILAEHTGRSIDLTDETEASVDLSVLFERGFGAGSFTEEIPEIKAKKSPKTLDERLLDRLSNMPAPLKIENQNQFNDAFSWIQRIADSTYMERWPHQGQDLTKALCKLTINYTRYLFDLPDYLRANGMKGDKSFTNIIERINKFVKKNKYHNINGLQTADTPKHKQWLNDTLNSYYHLQDCLKKKLAKSERLNGDRQIEKLKTMVFEEESGESIREQVMVIVQQTDVSTNDPRLSKLLIDYIKELNGSELRNLRASIRSYIEQVEAEENEPKCKKVLFPSFANKKLTVIGGDRRHDATLYLKSLLPDSVDFTWLDIASSNGSNARQSLKKSIETGGLDALIIIQKYISHGVTEPIKTIIKENPQCKSAMARGYGKAQLKLALEFITDQWSES